MASLHERARLEPSPSVYARAFGDDIVLLDFGRGEYFGLDPVGAEIWRGIEGGKDVGAIVADLVARYEVQPEQAERETLTLLNALRDAALVREV